MAKKYLFRILAVYSMGVLFLPIVFGNIPEPFDIFGRTLILAPIWIIILFLFQKNVLTSKYLAMIVLFFIILYLGHLTIWSEEIIGGIGNITTKWIYIDIYGLLLPTLMYQYFLKSRDFWGLSMVTFVTILFISITSVTSIIGLSLFPGATRLLVSDKAGEYTEIFRKMGIAEYVHIAGIVYLFPVLVYLIKLNSIKIQSKILLLIFVSLLFFLIIKTEFTTALALSAVFFSLALFAQTGLKKSSIVFFIMFCLLFFILNSTISELIYYISSFITSDTLKFRVNDIGKVLELRDFNPDSGATYFTNVRLSLVELSFSKFLQNPIVGGGWGGGHSTWIDRLGLFGLFGFFPWIIIFTQQIRLNLSIFSDSFKTYYLLSFLSCLALGLITTSANSVQSGAVLFFIIPGIYFMKHLEK